MKDNRPNQPKQTTSPEPRCSLHATGIHAGYKDGEDILAGVDLHARAGEVTTLIGPCLLYTSDAADDCCRV